MKLDRQRLLRLLVPGAVGVAVAVGAITITAYAAGLRLAPVAASKPSPSPSPTAGVGSKAQSYCQDFANRFAADLKTSTSKVESASSQALQQTLADAVKNGDLTQQQADAISSRVADQQACSSALAGIGKGHAKPGANAGANTALARYMQAYIAAAAAALGMQPADVNAALKNGGSLSQLAQRNGISEGDFRTRLIANLQPQLDQAVAQGTLTKDQETAILQHLQTGPLPLWNRAEKPKPSPSPSPAA